jgi:hypothetical protein
MNLKLKVEMDIDPEHKPLNLWIAANLYSVAYLFSTATSAIEPTAPQGITDPDTGRTIGTWQVLPDDEQHIKRAVAIQAIAPHLSMVEALEVTKANPFPIHPPTPRYYQPEPATPQGWESVQGGASTGDQPTAAELEEEEKADPADLAFADGYDPARDVCIAGEPAIDGQCGDPACVCSRYEPPTVEEWHSIADAFTAYGMDAHLEGGGAACTYIEVNMPDGQLVTVGDNNTEFWTASVYPNREAWEEGNDPAQSLETDVPTKYEGTGRHHDPETIADAVNRVLRLHLTPAD